MEAPQDQLKECTNCTNQIPVATYFCNVCGHAQNTEELKFHSEKRNNLVHVAIFFAVELLFCLGSLLITDQNIGTALFFDFSMAVTSILFFASSWKENKHLLRWPNFSVLRLGLYIIITIIASVVVNLSVTQLNELLFGQNFTFVDTYLSHRYGTLIMIFSIAIFPALFEELAYRGYLMQKLLNIVDKKEAIYITSILFFFIHFSMISFFWMLPFAIALAYVRLKENTIWYGIIMHLFFNFTTCLVEMHIFGANSPFNF